MEGVGIPPNIAAAIRRSQAARGAMRAQRRRAGLVVAALCLATAVPTTLTFTDFGGSDMLQAAVNKAESLVDMLIQRSPGQRTAAQLTKTKHKQIALAKMRAPPKPAVPDAHELAKILLGQPELPVALAAAPIPPIDLVPPALEAIVAPPPGNAIIIPPGGGGGGVVPGGGPPASNPNPPPNEPVVIPPVPEPATWMSMLLGFTLIGWSLRRRQFAQLQHAA